MLSNNWGLIANKNRLDLIAQQLQIYLKVNYSVVETTWGRLTRFQTHKCKY